MAHFGNFLDQEDKAQLQRILERKLLGLPPANFVLRRIFSEEHLEFDHPASMLARVNDGTLLDQILRGTADVNFPYMSQPQVLIDDGATLCGVLHYRDEIMRNVRNDKERKKLETAERAEGAEDVRTYWEDWDIQAIIAMFCSGLDKNHNFCLFFEQTRERVIYNYYHRLQKTDTSLQLAYTLACMDYEQFKGLEINPQEPTYHMRRFAELVKASPREFDKFFKDNRKTADKKKRLNYVKYHKDHNLEHADKAIKDNFEFIFPKGGEEVAGMLKKLNKPRKRRNKNKQTGQKAKAADYSADAEVQANRYGDYGFEYQGLAVVYDKSNVRPHLVNNPLLKALCKPSRDVLVKGEEVDIAEDSHDLRGLSDVLDGTTGETEAEMIEDHDLLELNDDEIAVVNESMSIAAMVRDRDRVLFGDEGGDDMEMEMEMDVDI